ncbi:MAG: CapA family protein [Patescibacteria group bacterium]
MFSNILLKDLKKNNSNITLLNFGDTMFNRGVEDILDQDIDPFEYIKGIEGNFLKGIDYISLNLEGPITDTRQCQKKDNNFKFDPEISGLLNKNNINIVNLANNHIFDCYEQGIENTKKYLNVFGIDYFGQADLSSSYVIKEVNRKKIVFLGIDQTIMPIAMNQFYDLIKRLKEDNDYIVVNIHWGYEYSSSPSIMQKQTAHNLIDNGADVIIGHHPHVIQPVEIYENKAIFYSLGNFIFDMKTEETNQGIGVGIIFDKDNYSFYLFPYEIINSQPKLFSYNRSISFCNQFFKNIINFNDCSFSL